MSRCLLRLGRFGGSIQPYRADVAKLLVHRRARRKGLGTAIIEAVETSAHECSKRLLFLDTIANGEGGLGGNIPRYALFPNGELDDTTIFSVTSLWNGF